MATDEEKESLATRHINEVDDCWIFLGAPSYHTHDNYGSIIESIIKINPENFMVEADGYLHQYNTKENTWTRIQAEHMDARGSPFIAYNSNSKQIYATIDSAMMITNIETPSKYKEYSCDQIQFSSLIFIDNICHIIGGVENEDHDAHDSHYIWDEQTKKVKHIHKFNEMKGDISGFGLVYDSHKQQMLLLGGFDSGRTEMKWRRDEIYRCDLSSSSETDWIWTKLDIKLPHGMNNFGCVLTTDNRYVIIMAGLGMDKNYDDIHVLDLNVMNIFAVDLKFPFDRICIAIIMEKKVENEFLVQGFVRNEMKEYGMDIPMELINFMCKWYCIEYLHVINEEMKQWKVNVDFIINAMIL